MKQKLIKAYIDTAKTFANCSSAIRLKVGAIIVKDDRILSIGYNGTPSGWDNKCETYHYLQNEGGAEWLDEDVINKKYPYTNADGLMYRLVTKPEVLHAESNCLSKLAKSHESGKDATMFCTHSPCLNCAKIIYQSGITTLYYDVEYKSDDGIAFLKKAGVNIIKVVDDE